MKKIILLVMTMLLTVNAIAAEPPKKVFINQIVQHPALDRTVAGIIDGLKADGYVQGKNIDIRVESAQASAALAFQISTKFVNQQADVVVGVGTVSSQSFLKYVNDDKAKLVFSSVTDPVQAGLVDSLQKPGRTVSGVSNFVVLQPQLELFKSIQPNLKKLGIIYNPAEANSVSIVKRLEHLCPKSDIALQSQAITKTADVAQAATKLASQVDAIFISNDNTALSAIETIIRIATQFKIPVYVSDTDAVALGALAALGPDQYQLGVQTAKLIARSLKGENLKTMPVEFPQKTQLFLNENAAALLAINLPAPIKKQANVIIPRKVT